MQILLALLIVSAQGFAQTTFNNSNSDSIWNVGANWSTSNPPTATQTAYVPSGLTGMVEESLFITDSGTLSASASVGTLVFNAALVEVRRLRPSNAANRGATLTFGSSTVVGAFELTPPEFTQQALFIGDTDFANDGTLTLSVPKGLDFRLDASTSPGSQVTLNAILAGAGTVAFSRGAGSNPVLFELVGPVAGLSTFEGGSRLDADVEVQVFNSSTLSQGTINYGPLGRGTANLNGGTLYTSGQSSGSIILHNPINVTADSAVFTSSGTRFVGAPVRTNGNELLLRMKNPAVVFDNSGWSASDTGTISLAQYNNSPAVVEFAVDGGSSIYGGYVTAASAGSVTTAIKSGAGTFGAGHFRVTNLVIDAGVLKVNNEGSDPYGGGADVHVSRVETLTIAGGATPTASLDLSNNELIIDYTGASPLNGGTNSVLFAQIQSAYNSGSWDGTGITSNIAASTAAVAGVLEPVLCRV